jgi:Divergent InlB B-repeat domain
VTSSPGGINCGGDCDEVYRQGTAVSLSQTANPGSVFKGWSGACSGTGACNVAMNNVRFVTADFELVRNLTVTVTNCSSPLCLGATVTSSSTPSQPGEPRINCTVPPSPHVCQTTYPNGVTVMLTATPAQFTFVTWGGACAGTGGNVCTLIMDADKQADASFLVGFGNPKPSADRMPDPGPSGPSLSWQSLLQAPGAQGQVLFNGQQPAFAGPGISHLTSLARAGENRVDARLQTGGNPGTWRFDLRTTESLEPGSLRVLEGEAALVLQDAIVFRLSGRAGEQLSFTFRLKP